MFKKFKDKLAEEVKSSPQRLQQFAQAAQAAVTSASSSISDITNNDLFSIGDSDSGSKSQISSISQQSTFRDASPVYQGSVQSGSDIPEATMMQEESQRQRRLSNSSLASDISFRLPSYESPSMYHLQSDMEVSASEAEEKGFTGVNVNLDRVTKEQLYSAYRRTQDRCKKYKTQYADLARHYKLLERENAKARNVLVETQDKALRRISELREQCSLEQSAKAHLERALRIEIDEKNMKIHALNTKLDLLQNSSEPVNDNHDNKSIPTAKEGDMQLINLNDTEQKESNEEALSSEITVLNNKLEKMEQLLNKYKESLKVAKEKNAQMTTELQILSSDLQTKCKENEDLKSVSTSLADSKKKIQELNGTIEELQNKCNTYEFTKNKETSILEINLQSAQEDILQLQSKIEELKKKEEEYAISLAENKLSIHKELESKEAEIKSLKDSLTDTQNELQSLHIVIDDYKNNITTLEAEKQTLNNDIHELTAAKTKMKDMEEQLEELKEKCQSLENSKAKLDEQYKCLQLQMKQETAEKLAMIDRNDYLESRNAQLTEENARKTAHINELENDIEEHCAKHEQMIKDDDHNILQEISVWKQKYQDLEREIQEEREELIKLQSEIEKLLRNYELVQNKNLDLLRFNSDLRKEIAPLQEEVLRARGLKKRCGEVYNKARELRKFLDLMSHDARSSMNLLKNEIFSTMNDKISEILKQESSKFNEKYNELKMFYDLSENERKNISNNYTATIKELQTLKEENNKYKIKIEEYKSDILRMEQSAAAQHKLSLSEITVLQTEIDNLKHKTENEYKKQLNADECLKKIEAENRNLRDKLTETENTIQLLNTTLNKEKELYTEKMQAVTAQHEVSLNDISVLKKELDNLKHKSDNDDKHHSNVDERLKTLEAENRDLQSKLIDSENRVQSLNTNLDQEQVLCKQKIEEIDAISNNYSSLTKENEENKNMIHKLQTDINNLTQENLTLKKLSETISTNVNDLESEMKEVRQSHAEIEREKDRLNNIIEELENKERSRVSSDKDSQTDFALRERKSTEKEENHDNIIKSAKTEKAEELRDAVHELMEEKIVMANNNSQLNNVYEQTGNKTSEISDIETKYLAMQNEYEVLKEENRRLHSDVEGLQTYLAKISKENSLLNDKLREYFASGENVPEKNEALNRDIEELKFEIQSGKERIDNLIRENTILEQENLELKDQIQSQSYNSYADSKPLHNNNNNTEKELQTVKDKYNNLMDVKTKMEKRLDDVEQMNQSVTDNMHRMQANNEKLRLSNEKLERRLDEALVSLRHLHSLQENTELEYLRNILYEYLTGSGTHSLTLAKVLAAVVKFSDSQTDLVMQKEKERQGFLRQMGLL
ncbi:uncharacterized protein Golgin245 [Epargyreus clarus]|uniref:uncharacterized protein Golgin245 n=1 Tax=Epargyreus clarus TaxID=520877 RepID=UPI003C2E1B77